MKSPRISSEILFQTFWNCVMTTVPAKPLIAPMIKPVNVMPLRVSTSHMSFRTT